jgi:hypothetical protein
LITSPLIAKPAADMPLGDDGFYQTISAAGARRQFNMSLGLVAALSAIAVVVGTSMGFAPVNGGTHAERQARIIVQQPQAIHVMQAQRDISPRG